MAINNVYNQTPKRIYTNKPFIKGMNYTNADMSEYVCKSVSNLDLESSNTSTKLRSGTKNKFISECNMIRFYSKLVTFANLISEVEYVNNIYPTYVKPDAGLGIKVLTEASGVENDIYDYIINTDSDLIWDGSRLETSNSVLSTSSVSIAALCLRDGTIPHVIHTNDYSLSFFGTIQNSAILYRGIIRLYFHASAQKVIIETVNASTIDPVDVNSYGSNIYLNNPLLFKDYVYFHEVDKDYYFLSGLNSEAADKKITDISTVMIYDSPVIYDYNMNLISGSTANVVKGTDKSKDEYIYIRPYCSIPKGDYVFATSIDTINGDMYYNFNNKSFEYVPNIKVTELLKNDTNTSSVITRSVVNKPDYKDPMSNTTGVTSEYNYIQLDSILTTDAYIEVNIKDSNMYTIPYGNNINLSVVWDFISYTMRNIEVEYKDKLLISDLYKYSRGKPYSAPITIKSKLAKHARYYIDDYNKMSIYEDKANPAYETGLKGLTRFGLGGYLRINKDSFIDGTRLIKTTTTVENLTIADAEIHMFIDNNKLYYNITIKPLLSDDGSLKFSNNIFAKYYYMKDQETGSTSEKTELKQVYDCLGKGEGEGDKKGENDFNILLPASSFHFTPTYDERSIFQRYNDKVTEPTYEASIDCTISIYDSNDSIPKTCVQSINLSNNTSSLNIAINSKSLASVPSGSVAFKVHLIPYNNNNNNDKDYITYRASYKVEAMTSYINTYKSELLMYNSLRENSNPLLATRITDHLGHYVLYGNSTGSNALYYSYYNDISYFPSTYVIEFDNPIVYVYNHQNNLIVFTDNDIHMVYNGTVPSTTSTDGNEVPFTVKLIQSNIRLGADNINTVKSIGKDIFFISSNNVGYLLKANKYVNDASDTYLLNVTTAIGDLLNSPYEYALSRYKQYNPYYIPSTSDDIFKLSPIRTFSMYEHPDFEVIPFDFMNLCDIPDGDTFYRLDNQGNKIEGYRLADVDTPEINHSDNQKSERLALIAHLAFNRYLQLLDDIVILVKRDSITQEIITDMYNRRLCYVLGRQKNNPSNIVCVNYELIKSGLASLTLTKDFAHSLRIDSIPLYNHLLEAYTEAEFHHRGIHNQTSYTINNIDSSNAIEGYNINYFRLFAHVNNNNICIVQSIVLRDDAALTIIYKYNIDNRTWITYDLPFPVFAYDSAPDNNYEGFKLYCRNTYKAVQTMSSILSFVDNRCIDEYSLYFNQYPSISINETGNIIYNRRYINVHFDTGNQSISIMNDKLFREFKIVLGTTTDKDLDIDYNIKFFVDEKEVKPNVHYKGNCSNENGGYKKITFLTPARGRIPRFIFNADCKSDLNILQYAIIYVQLNAK